jgi:hypothetical protein
LQGTPAVLEGDDVAADIVRCAHASLGGVSNRSGDSGSRRGVAVIVYALGVPSMPSNQRTPIEQPQKT